MPQESIHESLEGPLCEAVEVRPGMRWRPQDVRALRMSAKESCTEGGEPAWERAMNAVRGSVKNSTREGPLRLGPNHSG